MNSWQARVKEFHERFGCRVGESVAMRDDRLRWDLIAEESRETIQAIASQNLPQAVDGLVDLIYVCLGAAVAWGVDLEPMFNEVHRTNMAKEGGGSRADGKVLKPAGWTPPDIAGELKRQGWGG
jgi:predicted HAD superfamily Cof-like phosphohydrolase